MDHTEVPYEPKTNLNRPKLHTPRDLKIEVQFKMEDYDELYQFVYTIPILMSPANVKFSQKDRRLAGCDKWLGDIYDVGDAQVRVYVCVAEILREGRRGCRLHAWDESVDQKQEIPTQRCPVIDGITRLRMNQNYVLIVRLSTVLPGFDIAAITNVIADGTILELAEKQEYKELEGDISQMTAKVVFPVIDWSSTGQPHEFVNKLFILPTFCHWCGGFIWGILPPNGKQCWYCSYSVHNRCAIEASTNCTEKHDDDYSLVTGLSIEQLEISHKFKTKLEGVTEDTGEAAVDRIDRRELMERNTAKRRELAQMKRDAAQAYLAQKEKEREKKRMEEEEEERKKKEKEEEGEKKRMEEEEMKEVQGRRRLRREKEERERGGQNVA